MERIAVVIVIVFLLFFMGRLGAKLSSKHPRNGDNSVHDQDTDTEEKSR